MGPGICSLEKIPRCCWWELDVGTSALEISSKQAEQSTALHTVVSTSKYAVTWRERRKQHY